MSKKSECARGTCFIGCNLQSVFFCFIMLFWSGFGEACPQFVEFFPDPTDVSDQEGEFVEIRLKPEDVGNVYAPESLFVQLDSKQKLSFPFPTGERFLLVHDTTACPNIQGIACGSLGNVTLPNSRETRWTLQAGTCLDSASLTVPKAGKSFQRVKYTDEWVLTEATPGMGNPRYELDLRDCGIDRMEANPLDSSGWGVELHFSGCDSTVFHYTAENLFSGSIVADSGIAGEVVPLKNLEGAAFRIQVDLPGDQVTVNDRLDTMIVMAGKSPLVISEIHHCPQEPEPEWVEVYNRGKSALPLDAFRFCDRGGSWSGVLDEGESLVFSKDTAALRLFLGFRDARLFQTALGFLNNTSGALSLCYGKVVLDFVSWDKSLVSCPSGFNPLTNRPENTPGYQSSRSSFSGDLFTYKLSSRVVRKNKTPLFVYIENFQDVSLKLLDSTGHCVWSQIVPAGSCEWWKVPADSLLNVGVAYISISAGKKEQMVGILVRP